MKVDGRVWEGYFQVLGQRFDSLSIGRFLLQDFSRNQILDVGGREQKPDGITILDLAVEVVLNVPGVFESRPGALP